MNEKTTEQKIKEYVWLHADKSLRKIQAGILEEYGESKSLDWISNERQAYLSADEHPMEENSFVESSNDEAIRGVAEAFPNVTEEQIREVATLKTTTRLGYRKIGKRLDPPLGKDTVMRIWKIYETRSRSPKPPIEDEEIKKLKAQVAEKERLKRLRDERERLLKQSLLLSLEIEGDNLILRIVDELAKEDPAYAKFRENRAALQKIGVTASKLIDTFDLWYDFWRKHKDSEMKCLKSEVAAELLDALFPEE